MNGGCSNCSPSFPPAFEECLIITSFVLLIVTDMTMENFHGFWQTALFSCVLTHLVHKTIGNGHRGLTMCMRASPSIPMMRLHSSVNSCPFQTRNFSGLSLSNHCVAPFMKSHFPCLVGGGMCSSPPFNYAPNPIPCLSSPRPLYKS